MADWFTAESSAKSNVDDIEAAGASIDYIYTENTQSSVDITEGSRPSSFQVRLDRLFSEIPQHTIYRVHSELRNVHTKSYEPKIIAIGPLHSGNHNLMAMENHKWQYAKAFLQRKGISKDDCISAIEGREAEARKCYAEEINLNPTEFLEMLVLDACFIIELALRCEAGGRTKGDPILNMPWMRNHIFWDLMLFENQIPLFVICEIWNFIRGALPEVDLMELLLEMLQDFYLVKKAIYYRDHIDLASVKHLLELIHISFTLTYGQAKYETTVELKCSAADNVIKSAMRLAESNVSFARIEPGDSIFQIEFRNGCMRLPQLEIQYATESFWRNMIAYEQYFLDCKDCYFTDLAVVMDRLIDTKEDVKLLVKFGIIENCLGSEEAVADIFNRLTDNVILSSGDGFTYKPLFQDVRGHCSRRRNSWMAKLKANHFNNPWAVISILAAFVLLLLTFLQTLYTIM